MIFISHRQADAERAVRIQRFLAVQNIACYVDVLDPNMRNPSDITEYIVDKIRRCSHILAVYSRNTVGSMWVPFELGAAYEADKGIGTFVFDSLPDWNLPDYLKSVPILRTDQDLSMFAREVNQETIMRKSILLSEKSASTSSYASSFIRTLKSKLGQS